MNVGYLDGNLRLIIGTESLNLGNISVPITAKQAPRTYSGAEAITIRLSADLEEVRNRIAKIFREGASDE